MGSKAKYCSSFKYRAMKSYVGISVSFQTLNLHITNKLYIKTKMINKIKRLTFSQIIKVCCLFSLFSLLSLPCSPLYSNEFCHRTRCGQLCQGILDLHSGRREVRCLKNDRHIKNCIDVGIPYG